VFRVWREGYLGRQAAFLGERQAGSFREACDLVCADVHGYDPDDLRIWACYLFDNEADARKSFG
jgi:hypothetical protein